MRTRQARSLQPAHPTLGWCCLETEMRGRGARPPPPIQERRGPWGCSELIPLHRRLPALHPKELPGCLSIYPFPQYAPQAHTPLCCPAHVTSSPSPSLAGRILGASLPAAPFSSGPPWPCTGRSSPLQLLDSQLPLVVAMQERVGRGPHCEVAAARVHQDVELREGGESAGHWHGRGLTPARPPCGVSPEECPPGRTCLVASAGPQASETVSLPPLENHGIFCVVRATVCGGVVCPCLPSAPLPVHSVFRARPSFLSGSPRKRVPRRPPGWTPPAVRSWHRQGE